MSDRILGTIAKALADDEDVTALDYDEARNILAAFEANRIALVELPEPDEHEDEEQEFTDFPGVGLYVPVVFDGHPGEVQIRAGAWCDEPLSVDEARGLAASILAAASYAEEAEE
ncbi:hypothetical protein SEA_EJIMIX_79 [Mycobacterium phage Ejimix]|nr:hypothetical protein SEA_DMPSTRDIVER_80 [Mycobacterium phage DmpstrDiver]AXQ52081.1 hypothetical protein SEA_EJIMIX_79 [Mycobacterium phage Ejimix]AXQ52313.1 hypothetical protein SEA_ERICMILLARD_78 [Mycobacterium phage EricMillard]AXQ62484.1 hypothetical protein SEA_ZELINK_77 [Mycobacterium phage Zelink]AYB69561.1 hypothetical protein SEA_KALAH2_74 [Mycobacterium phage Kalah2]QBI97525.1 hypothetical protein SEA_HUGHESYANG_79 [Mycobacterium phage Hughesyang]QBI99712.1 hypothetical protein S